MVGGVAPGVGSQGMSLLQYTRSRSQLCWLMRSCSELLPNLTRATQFLESKSKQKKSFLVCAYLCVCAPTLVHLCIPVGQSLLLVDPNIKENRMKWN